MRSIIVIAAAKVLKISEFVGKIPEKKKKKILKSGADHKKDLYAKRPHIHLWHL